jgi:hypothetical protein
MGGTIWVDSRSGEGSTFHFIVPFLTAGVTPGTGSTLPSSALAGKGPNGPYRVLLAEDNLVDQRLAWPPSIARRSI